MIDTGKEFGKKTGYISVGEKAAAYTPETHKVHMSADGWRQTIPFFCRLFVVFLGSPRDPEARSHRRRRTGQLLRTRRRGCCSGGPASGRGGAPHAGRRGRRGSCKANQGVGRARRPRGRRQRFPLRPLRLLHGGRGGVPAPHPAAPGRHRLLPVPAVRRLLRLVRLPQQASLHRSPRAGRRGRAERRARPPLARLLTPGLPSDPGGGRRRKPGLQGVRPAFWQGLGPQHALPDPRHGLPHRAQNRQAPVGSKGSQSASAWMISMGGGRDCRMSKWNSCFLRSFLNFFLYLSDSFLCTCNCMFWSRFWWLNRPLAPGRGRPAVYGPRWIHPSPFHCHSEVHHPLYRRLEHTRFPTSPLTFISFASRHLKHEER